MLGQPDLLAKWLVQVEHSRWNAPWSVGLFVSRKHHERLGGGLGLPQHLNRVLCQAVVEDVALVHHAAEATTSVGQHVATSRGIERLAAALLVRAATLRGPVFWRQVSEGLAAPHCGLAPRRRVEIRWRACVICLPSPNREVPASSFEVLRHALPVGAAAAQRGLAEADRKAPHQRRAGAAARHEAIPGRTAKRLLAVRTLEEEALRREPVQVGCYQAAARAVHVPRGAHVVCNDVQDVGPPPGR